MNWVFLATTEGEIRSVNLSASNNISRVLISKQTLELNVAHLSVDWLHNKLYIVGKKRRSSNWVIKRCDLDGHALTTIYSTLPAK